MSVSEIRGPAYRFAHAGYLAPFASKPFNDAFSLGSRVRAEMWSRMAAATDSCRVIAGLDPQVGFTRLAALKSCGTRASPSSGAIHPLRKKLLAKDDGPAGQARG